MINKSKYKCSDNWNRLIKAIPDIEEHIKQDKIKVSRLIQYTKDKPLDKDYYFKKVSLKELKVHKGNYGIIVGYNNGKNGSSIAVADIDGYTITESDNIPLEKKEEIKQYTKEYIYNCLKDIPEALIVKTQSGGYHFYLWNETEVNNIHNISNSLTFPSDFPIEELRNKSLKHSIEIFTKFKSKYVDLPSNLVKSNGNINKYEVISDINKLSDVGTVNNIHNTIKEKMVANGFGFNTSKDKKRTNRTNSSNRINNSSKNKKLKQLSKEEIKAVVDLTTTKYKLFEAIDGEKHYGALALGGYFSYHISKGSAERIATGIIKKVPSGLFRNSADFKRDILVSYDRPVEEKQGLPTLIEYIENKDLSFNTDTFSEELNLICNSNYIKEKVGTAIFKDNSDKEIEVPIYLYETYYRKYLKYQGILEGIDLTLDFSKKIGSFIYSNTGKTIDSFEFKFKNNFFKITNFNDLKEFLETEGIIISDNFDKYLNRSLSNLDKSITKPKIIEESIVKADVPDSIVFGVTEESYYQQTEEGIKHIKPTEKGYISKPIANVVIKDVTIILDSLGLFDPVYNVTYYNKTFNKEVTVKYKTKKQLIEEFIKANVFYHTEAVETVLNTFIIDGSNEGRIETKTEAYLEGYFYINGKVIANTPLNNIKKPTKEDVAEAINLLNEIMKDRTVEGKANDSAVYRFKLWNPFSYCLKQLGYAKANYSLIEIGDSQTNKTGASKVGDLFYNRRTEETSGSTVSVLGSKIGEGTFSTTFDECNHLFKDVEGLNVMKRAIYETTGRAVKDRNDNTKIDEFPALNLPAFILNPDDTTFKDYIRNRYKIINYTSKSFISSDTITKFIKEYLPESEDTILNKLAYIGYVFSEKIIAIIEDKDRRKELMDIEGLTIEILEEIATEVGVDFLPEMYTTTEVSNEYDYDIKTEIVNFLNEEFKNKNMLKGKPIDNSNIVVRSIKHNDFPFIFYNQNRNNEINEKEFIINISQFKKYITKNLEENVSEETIIEALDLVDILKAKADYKEPLEEYIKKQHKIQITEPSGEDKAKTIAGIHLKVEELATKVFSLNLEEMNKNKDKEQNELKKSDKVENEN